MSLPVNPIYLSFLNDEDVQVISSLISYKQVKKNTILISRDKPVNDVYYVQKGIVRLFMVNQEGEEINTHFAWNGMFITSFYSLINNKPSDEAVIAITDCELYHFRYQDLAALFDKHPKIERLGRILSEEAFCCLAERSRMLQTLTAGERYLHMMENTPKEFFLQISLQDIASYLGIAPGSLSRIRNEFLHKG
ncbi:MAG: Crp/Fnr family transcriptional regulator [Cytophagaceae bacterium]